MTENEIRAMPLEAKQKLVLELKQVKPDDKAYPNARAIIELITSDKKYKEPETVKVKALNDVPVDGRDVKRDQVVDVFPWQYRALSRFLEPVAKAAAVLALACLPLAGSVQAQSSYTVTQVVGPSTSTNTSVFTNYIASSASSNYTTAVITTNTTTSVAVTNINGQPTFTVSTNSTTLTNYPGVINMTHWDALAIAMGGNLAATASTNGTIVSSWSVSDDNTLWVTNAFTLTCTASGVTPVGAWTNLTLFHHGYVRLDTISNNNTQAMTNAWVTIAKKPIRMGP